jgi:hypothetical protein
VPIRKLTSFEDYIERRMCREAVGACKLKNTKFSENMKDYNRN